MAQLQKSNFFASLLSRMIIVFLLADILVVEDKLATCKLLFNRLS